MASKIYVHIEKVGKASRLLSKQYSDLQWLTDTRLQSSTTRSSMDVLCIAQIRGQSAHCRTGDLCIAARLPSENLCGMSANMNKKHLVLVLLLLKKLLLLLHSAVITGIYV